MISPAGRSRFKAVLFDKDGTLLDFDATWLPILREVALDLADGDEAEAARLLRVGGYDPAVGRIAPGSPLAAGNTREIIELWYPRESAARQGALAEQVDACFHAGAAARSVPVPRLAETLDTLVAAGFLLGIATSDSTATARAGIGSLGLADRFACILGYDSVPRSKPAPDMVMAFCRVAEAAPSEVVVVGDSRHDLDMARSAGAGAAIGVLGGTSGSDDLAALADVLLGSIAELPGWLGIASQDRPGG